MPRPREMNGFSAPTSASGLREQSTRRTGDEITMLILFPASVHQAALPQAVGQDLLDRAEQLRAPSVMTSSGDRRPRATSSRRNPRQASVDSALAPSRVSRTGLPSLVVPR